MGSNLFARKPLSALSPEDVPQHLHRTLTATNLVALGVGEIIGAGIFVLTGQAAAQYAGPAIILSFVISGIACAFAALCYAELAAMIPIAGSAYTYAYATLGELAAWIIGWDLTLEYLFGGSAVAVGWSGYVVSFLNDIGIHLPAALTQGPVAYDAATGWRATGAICNLPAVLIILAMTYFLVLGIRESARLNNVIVFVKMAVIVLFIIFGLSYIQLDHFTPFIPENTGAFGHFGFSGVLRAAGVIFFAYIGFDAVSTTAQEAKNPQRDLPIGILGSFVVATVLYVLVSFVIVGLVDYRSLNVPDPVAVALNAAGPGLAWLSPALKLGAIAGLSSVVLVSLLGQPRILFAMSQDGLLPPWFSKVHPKFRTPHLTTILTGVVAALIAGVFPINILGELVSIGTLFAFLIVCVGVLILRRTDPDAKRPFRTPWSPVVPVLGALCALLQMVALPLDTWLRLAVWMAIGFAIYFTYGRRNSRVAADLNE